jgi:type 1 glutamine amidotransferase
VIFLSEGAKWSQADPRRSDALAQLAARGGGIVGLHWGIGCKAAEPIPNFLKLLGGCHGGDDRKYAVLDTKLEVADPKHPITQGIKDLKVHEELYYRLKFVAPAGSVHPLLSAKIDGRDETVAWSWERPDGGRSFGFSGLHFHDNWRHREYRMLVSQAALWTLGLPIPDDGIDVELPIEALKLP